MKAKRILDMAWLLTSVMLVASCGNDDGAVLPFIERVSVGPDGMEADSGSYSPDISADGRYVAFVSSAANFVSGVSGHPDIFVRDRQTGETTCVSVATDGTPQNQYAGAPAISDDGRYVAFSSAATNLVDGDTNHDRDIFVHDRDTGETTRVSVATDGTQANLFSIHPAISADGRYVAFASPASTLVMGDAPDYDIFVHDRETGETMLITARVAGVDTTGAGYNYSWKPAISADGRYVAFESTATDLVAGDTNGVSDIFVRDRGAEATTRVSIGPGGVEADGDSYNAKISGDGRYVVFESMATNLVAGDTNERSDIFVHDRETGITTRVSLGARGAQSNFHSYSPSISADGRYVAFHSTASNLVSDDTKGMYDIFVHDRDTRTTTRVSAAMGGAEADDDSGFPAISADGRSVAFSSDATNLVVGDTNRKTDIFVAPVK